LLFVVVVVVLCYCCCCYVATFSQVILSPVTPLFPSWAQQPLTCGPYSFDTNEFKLVGLNTAPLTYAFQWDSTVSASNPSSSSVMTRFTSNGSSNHSYFYSQAYYNYGQSAGNATIASNSPSQPTISDVSVSKASYGGSYTVRRH
jgi:hypothetical protein